MTPPTDPSEPARQRWVIPLPFVKPLSLNDRQHHMVKARLVKQWRDATAVCVKAARVPHCDRVSARLTYIPKVNRRRDPDNLVASYKPVVDALVDAGVVDDDTQEYVERYWPYIAGADAKLSGGRFTLVVEAL